MARSRRLSLLHRPAGTDQQIRSGSNRLSATLCLEWRRWSSAFQPRGQLAPEVGISIFLFLLDVFRVKHRIGPSLLSVMLLGEMSLRLERIGCCCIAIGTE